VRVGELVTYTITLSNSGTTTATVAVTDVLDARLSYVGANIAPDSTAGGVLAWHGVVVPAGEARHITVTVRAGANTPLWASYVVTNSVQISLPVADDGAGCGRGGGRTAARLPADGDAAAGAGAARLHPDGDAGAVGAGRGTVGA
jgi:uncharacterized repeat protein (TIGR01451 family)